MYTVWTKNITCYADFKLYSSYINNTSKCSPSYRHASLMFILSVTQHSTYCFYQFASHPFRDLSYIFLVPLSQEILQHFAVWHTAQKRYSKTSLRINVTGIWIKFQQTRTMPYKQLSFPLTQLLMRLHSNKHFYTMPWSCSLTTRPLSSATVNTL